MADPTPQQRADYLVRKLEQFIRDGRGERGMSFRTWQAMARSEIANAFAEMERRQIRARSDRTAKRIILTAASALVTIGFWGAVMAVDKSYGWLAAALMLMSGVALLVVGAEIGLRRWFSGISDDARERRLGRIESFDRQIKALEAEMKRKLDRLKEESELDR